MFKVGKKKSKFSYSLSVHSASNIQGFDNGDMIFIECSRHRKSYRTHVVLRGDENTVHWEETLRFSCSLYRKGKQNRFASKKFSLKLLCDEKSKRRVPYIGELDMAQFASVVGTPTSTTIVLSPEVVAKGSSDHGAKLKLTVVAKWAKDRPGRGRADSDASSVQSYSTLSVHSTGSGDDASSMYGSERSFGGFGHIGSMGNSFRFSRPSDLLSSASTGRSPLKSDEDALGRKRNGSTASRTSSAAAEDDQETDGGRLSARAEQGNESLKSPPVRNDGNQDDDRRLSPLRGLVPLSELHEAKDKEGSISSVADNFRLSVSESDRAPSRKNTTDTTRSSSSHHSGSAEHKPSAISTRLTEADLNRDNDPHVVVSPLGDARARERERGASVESRSSVNSHLRPRGISESSDKRNRRPSDLTDDDVTPVPILATGLKPAVEENPRIDLFSPMAKESMSRTSTSMASNSAANLRPSPMTTRSRGNSKTSNASDGPRELLPERPSQKDTPEASPLLQAQSSNGAKRSPSVVAEEAPQSNSLNSNSAILSRQNLNNFNLRTSSASTHSSRGKATSQASDPTPDTLGPKRSSVADDDAESTSSRLSKDANIAADTGDGKGSAKKKKGSLRRGLKSLFGGGSKEKDKDKDADSLRKVSEADSHVSRKSDADAAVAPPSSHGSPSLVGDLNDREESVSKYSSAEEDTNPFSAAVSSSSKPPSREAPETVDTNPFSPSARSDTNPFSPKNAAKIDGAASVAGSAADDGYLEDFPSLDHSKTSDPPKDTNPFSTPNGSPATTTKAQRSVSLQRPAELDPLMQEMIIEQDSINDYGARFWNGIPISACIIFRCLVEWDAFQPRRQFILREITASVEQVVHKQLQDNGELGFWITNVMLLEHLAKRYKKAHKDLDPRSLEFFVEELDTHLQKMFTCFLTNVHMKLDNVPYESLLNEDEIDEIGSPTIEIVTNFLSSTWLILEQTHCFPSVRDQLMSQLFWFINCQLFNRTVKAHPRSPHTDNFCTMASGMRLQVGTSYLENWCRDNTGQRTATYCMERLKPIKQLATLLMIDKSFLEMDILRELTSSLNPVQSHHILRRYNFAGVNSDTVPTHVLRSLELIQEDPSAVSDDPSSDNNSLNFYRLQLNPLDDNDTFDTELTLGKFMVSSVEVPHQIADIEGFKFLKASGKDLIL